MAATLRELRGRIRSAGSIKKITKAQEMIATSRIAKAQARVEAARPYAAEITNMLTNLANESALDHPLLVERENPSRAGVLVVSSDRGLCGGVQRQRVPAVTRSCSALLRQDGKTPILYVVGRKALELLQLPELGRRGLVDRFLRAAQPTRTRRRSPLPWSRPSCAGADDEGDDPGPDGILGVDELHIVYTEFKSMMSQTAVAHRIAPMVVEYVEEDTGPHTLFSFEPDADDACSTRCCRGT